MPGDHLFDMSALRAARQWADDHRGHQSPDDRLLAAYGAALLASPRVLEEIRNAVEAACDENGFDEATAQAIIFRAEAIFERRMRGEV